MSGIFGIGIDVVEISRIAAMRERQGDRFRDLIFLPNEIDYCLGRVNSNESFAARFAAKEAVMKALGTGWAEGVAFTGIEVVREGILRPEIVLHGTTAERALELGAGRIHISLTHSREVAMAEAVIEKK